MLTPSPMKPKSGYRLRHYCCFVCSIIVILFILSRINFSSFSSHSVSSSSSFVSATTTPIILNANSDNKKTKIENHVENHVEEEKVPVEVEKKLILPPHFSLSHQNGARVEIPTSQVKCLTSKGDFTISLYRSWAPLGYDRFMDLIKIKWFDSQLLYRVIPGFLVQFGVPSSPSKANTQEISLLPIPDDPDLKIPFKKGTLSFAGSGPNSRTYHVFIADEPAGTGLGSALHERPFGQIIDFNEQKFLDHLYSYGDLGNQQFDLLHKGNEEFLKLYPLLDQIYSCQLVS